MMINLCPPLVLFCSVPGDEQHHGGPRKDLDKDGLLLHPEPRAAQWIHNNTAHYYVRWRDQPGLGQPGDPNWNI